MSCKSCKSSSEWMTTSRYECLQFHLDNLIFMNNVEPLLGVSVAPNKPLLLHFGSNISSKLVASIGYVLKSINRLIHGIDLLMFIFCGTTIIVAQL